MPRPDERAAVLALAVPVQDVAVDPDAVVLSAHAVQRYRERVESVPRKLAARRLRHLLTAAEWQHRPRAWTDIVLHPRVTYGYSPDRPDVCLLVRDRVLVTVMSRKFLDRAIPRPRAGRCG